MVLEQRGVFSHYLLSVVQSTLCVQCVDHSTLNTGMLHDFPLPYRLAGMTWPSLTLVCTRACVR